jgi:hypothetical protein
LSCTPPPDREQLPLAKVPDLWAELKQARVTVTFDATNQKITPSRVTLTFDARRPEPVEHISAPVVIVHQQVVFW